MKILSATIAALSMLSLALPVRADDELIDVSFAGGLKVAESQSALHGVKLHFWGEGARPAIEGSGREVTVSRRTRRRDNDADSCEWVMAAVLKELAMEARKSGDDLVVDIRSNWKHDLGTKPGSFQCALGKWVAGAAVRAVVGKSAGAGAASRAAAADKPAAQEPPARASATVARGNDGMGNTTYEVVVGNRLVGAKLTAIPDALPGRVRLALGLAADPGTPDAKPHEACGVELEAGGARQTLPAPRYLRSREQETLYTDLTTDQLRQLAAADGALSVCATRVNVKEASREYLKALVEAIDEHVANKPRAVKPGEGLSL
jgi:hypothetical protein